MELWEFYQNQLADRNRMTMMLMILAGYRMKSRIITITLTLWLVSLQD